MRDLVKLTSLLIVVVVMAWSAPAMAKPSWARLVPSFGLAGQKRSQQQRLQRQRQLMQQQRQRQQQNRLRQQRTTRLRTHTRLSRPLTQPRVRLSTMANPLRSSALRR